MDNQSKGLNITATTSVFCFRIGARVSEILCADGELKVGSNQLTKGEISALSYCAVQFDITDKPDSWIAFAMVGYSAEPIYASLEGKSVTVTGGYCSDDVKEIIIAAVTGMEARAPWNSDVDFGVIEIEGAKSYLAGWSSASDPYRNKDSAKGFKWLSGWEAAKSITIATS